ncbi:MAG: hypothetical protein QOH63_4076 [Acidobacteriota bacterium]|nr:hypothetical protein [Acidobacteriota bacterium]
MLPNRFSPSGLLRVTLPIPQMPRLFFSVARTLRLLNPRRVFESNCALFSTLVLQDDSASADGPALLFVHEKREKRLLGLTLLLYPSAATVVRA